MKVDAFFEGGGILGISFIGAYKALMDRGIYIDKVIGISAGSIVATLIAAEFSANELIEIIKNYGGFSFFKQKTITAKKNYIGKPLSLLLNKGIYDSQPIEDFMDKILSYKDVYCFDDVMCSSESRLKIIATDFTNKRLFLLPDDLPLYGYEKHSYSISKAVRMSCAIPFYYTPYELKTDYRSCYIIDGAVIRRIPTSIINNYHDLKKLTLRFKIVDQSKKWREKFKDIKNTWKNNEEDKTYERIITIPHDKSIKTTDFDLSKDKIRYLFNQGYKATTKFIIEEFY